MDRHDERVKAIASKVADFHTRKEPFRIYHGSTNSTRAAYFDRDKVVDTSQMNNVLKVDKTKMTVLVEPNVAMDLLVDSTLPHGVVPPVIMEFPGITVGGGFSGTSAESSSFKHGLFEQTIVSIEIVLATGKVLKASAEENSDLFHGTAGAFGTLGVLTLLEVKLIEAKDYVRLTYLPVRDMPSAIQAIDSSMADADFIDGIMYEAGFGLIIKGHLVDKRAENLPLVSFTRRRDPWFYLHARKRFPAGITTDSKLSPVSEYVPLRDYLFRYDRGGFWVARYAFRYFFTPFNRVTRFLLDRYMHTRIMYHALHASGLAQRYVVQDVCVPVSSASAMLDYTERELKGFYPLWLCPLPGPNTQDPPHPHSSAVRQKPLEDPTEKPWLLNFGVWGPLRSKKQTYEAFVDVNRDLEHKVRQFGGVKTLYAHAYYTEEEFNAIYPTETWAELRTKYDATGLPTVFDKVHADEVKDRRAFSGIKAIRPIGGVLGVLSVVLRKDYMLGKVKNAA